MEKNKNCSVCNIKLDINNYKKDRTVCRDCYNKKKRKNNLLQNEITISQQQPKIENNNNNRTLLVGPSFSGKTYLMLKILSRIPNRDIYIITKSPPEQYTNSKIKIKEISDEIKPVNEYENGIIVFDDILGSSNSRFIDQFFIRGRHNNLDIYYLSQSYFDLLKRTITKNSNKIILFNQTLKDIEHIYTEMSRVMIRIMMNLKNFVENHGKKIITIFILIDLKREIKENIVLVMKAKKTYLDATPQTKPFQLSYKFAICFQIF